MSRFLLLVQCLASGALILAMVGCGDSSAPTRGPGARYELTSYEDQPLPYTWRRLVSSPGTYACDDQITSGRLLFRTNHSVMEVFDRALVCNDGSEPLISADTATGQYTETGDQLDLVLQGTLTAEGGSPYQVSARLDGDVIRVEKTVSTTQVGTLTDVGVKIFTLGP